MKEKYLLLERKFSLYLKNRSITLLSFAMGIIYVWFGLLKIAGISPVEELVEHATHWAGVHEFVILIGVWEMAIGLCFFFRKVRRLGLWLLFLHFPGTFLPLFLNPEDCFTLIPFGLTLEGQYILKNLVNIAAGLVLISSLHNGNE